MTRLLLLFALISQSSLARADNADREFLIIGATAGVANTGPRLGPDLSYLWGKCRDSCGGLGVTTGLINPVNGEYFIGFAGGGAYFGTAWTDAAVRIRDGKFSGFHASYGLGFALMGYVALGFGAIDKQPSGEVGVTLKWPILQRQPG